VFSEQLPQGAARHPGDQRCDRFGDWLQEQRSLGLIAARAQHRRAILARICREILRKGRLADPGLPDDHDQARTAGHGAVPGLAQRPGLLVPPCQYSSAPIRACGTTMPHRTIWMDRTGRGRVRIRPVTILLAQDSQVKFLCLRCGVGTQFLS
jgi:hypothetical protein